MVRLDKLPLSIDESSYWEYLIDGKVVIQVNWTETGNIEARGRSGMRTRAASSPRVAKIYIRCLIGSHDLVHTGPEGISALWLLFDP